MVSTTKVVQLGIGVSLKSRNAICAKSFLTRRCDQKSRAVPTRGRLNGSMQYRSCMRMFERVRVVMEWVETSVLVLEVSE